MDRRLPTMLLLAASLALLAGCLENEEESAEGEFEVEGEGEGRVTVDESDLENVSEVDLNCERTDSDSGTCTVDTD